ncbi:MAG: hypothetical protein PWP23_747 [Candidatus Sumerlaeota bacterium]|nr:hypothetical protein [Candidatus Sumerlaeota bacterium]
MEKRRRLLRDGSLVVLALVFFVFCVFFQNYNYRNWVVPSGKYVQKVNLPNAEIIKVAAMGYDNLYADFLTLRAIQSFGAAWDTESGDIEPIYNYFDILTTLDPHFIDVYELGHLVISDDHREHEKALELLRKGIRNNPSEWKLPYLGMYTTLYDMKEPERADEFLHVLQNIPGTPEHILRMDEYIKRQSGQYHAAWDINLGHYLRYTDHELSVESRVALSKARVILNQWYRLELARSAEAYYQKHGADPVSIEQMLQEEESTPRFTAPTIESLHNVMFDYLERGEQLEPNQDAIREAAMLEIVGLPPEPEGTWYYLNPYMRSDAIEADLPEDAGIEERFGYFESALEVYSRLDAMGVGVQSFIMENTDDQGNPPDFNTMAKYLREDGFGGHWVYKRDPVRFFSTTQKRRIERNDPRLGMHGLLEDFPRRQFPVTEDQPEYLTTNPTVWDFPDDIEWALCKGLIPGVRIDDQPSELLDQARSIDSEYLPCSEHVELPIEPEVPER